jgi:VWA domain-containing protein
MHFQSVLVKGGVAAGLKRRIWPVTGAILLLASTAIPQAARQTAQPSRSVAIVIDDSASAGSHQEEIARSVQQFLKFFGEDDELCIYAAAERPALWQDFTSDEDVLANRVARLYGRGKLALYDTIAAAGQHLQNEATNEQVAIVVFVAGEDNASSKKLGDLLQGPGAKIPTYVVAGPDEDWRIQEPLQQLAFQNGGRAYFASTGTQLLEIARQTGWRITGHTELANAADEQKPLAPYKAVVVPGIPIANSKATEQISGGDNVLLHRVLVSRLRKSGLFPEVIDAGSGAAPVASPGSGRLELLATIVGYQQGSRMKRELLAFGGGTKLKVQVVLREGGNTQPVTGFVTEANAASGLFGGNAEKIETEAIIRAADQIVAELRKRK